MEEAACIFTIAIKNVISIFRVPVVIVGGQLCENNPLFFSFLQERVKQKEIPIQLYQEENFSSKIIIGLTSETVERLLGK